MSIRLDQTIGTFEPDNLVNRAYPRDACSVQIAAGQGALLRGTALTGTPGAEQSVLAAAVAAGAAVYILSDTLDTGTDTDADAVVGIAYRTGHFNRNRLITGGSYALTAADEEVFRQSGILLDDAFN